MTSGDKNMLDIAKNHWNSNDALEAGRTIFESLLQDVKPNWAISVLSFVDRSSTLRIEPIKRLLTEVSQPANWSSAKPLFSNIRKVTLQLEQQSIRSRDEELAMCHLYLAENVAKVIYNATDPVDPFDEDSGWWIAACLKHCIDLVGDEHFAKDAWEVLSSTNV